MVAVGWQRLIRKKHAAGVVVVFLALMMLLWSQTLEVLDQVNSMETGHITTLKTMKSSLLQADEVQMVLEARRDHYQRVCDVMQQSGGLPGLVQAPLVYLPANFSLCWVPKVACTYWMRVFFYLYNDTHSPWNPRPVKSPFDVDRLFVHYDGGQETKTLRFDDAHGHDVIFHTLRVMFSRDPWRRLWSGNVMCSYIDKFVLPDSWLDHGRRILRVRERLTTDSIYNNSQSTVSFLSADERENKTNYDTKCPDDISFAEFLHYAMLVNHDAHWSPVHLTCNPCLFRPQLLGKLETFSEDASYVLRTSGLGRLLPPHDSSHLDHVTDEIKLLVDYHFRLWDRRLALHPCLDRVGLARRLWRGFQLNGYIPMTFVFPEELLMHQLNDVDLFVARDSFTNYVLSVSSGRTLNLTQWSALRRRIMAKAYQSVPRELLKLVQKRFKLDFELFQYDPAPSDLFTVDKQMPDVHSKGHASFK